MATVTINYLELIADVTGERAELEFFGRIMESHSEWAHSDQGAALSETCMAALLGIASYIPPARGILDLPEVILMTIDSVLAKQPPRFRRILEIEYQFTANPDGGFASQEYKAKHYFRIKRDLYRVRLTAAELCMINALRPTFDEWMRLYNITRSKSSLTPVDSVC